MTLAERLREIATWLDGEANELPWNHLSTTLEYRTKAAELRAFADYVDGRVLTKPDEYPPFDEEPSFVIELNGFECKGETIEKARAELQWHLDRRDGRVRP